MTQGAVCARPHQRPFHHPGLNHLTQQAAGRGAGKTAVSGVLALQAEGPAFDPQYPTKSQVWKNKKRSLKHRETEKVGVAVDASNPGTEEMKMDTPRLLAEQPLQSICEQQVQ